MIWLIRGLSSGEVAFNRMRDCRVLEYDSQEAKVVVS